MLKTARPRVAKANLKARPRTASKNQVGINSDVFGSYTGIDLYDKYSEPIQDVDDL